MNKRSYGIGLDMGSSSVGWVVVDENGKIIRIKGKYGIGVRLFKEGQTAEVRRLLRGTRRRYSRRKWRLRLLDDIFDKPITSIDPNFFKRKKQSDLAKGDKRFENKYQIFSDQSDSEFYKKYHTIYHLRSQLISEKRRFDIREVYLAIHHIVKYRGNFLRSGAPATFKPGKINLREQFEALNDNWKLIFGEKAPQLSMDDVPTIQTIFLDKSKSRLDRQKEATEVFLKTNDKKFKSFFNYFVKSILGLKTKIDIITGTEVDPLDKAKWNISLENIEDVFDDMVSKLDDSGVNVLNELINLHAVIQLTEIIPSGQQFSARMVEVYKQHAEDLKLLKEYANKQSNSENGKLILAAYDKYIHGQDSKKADTIGQFYSAVKKFVKKDAPTDVLAQKIYKKIELEQFMLKQRSKANISIPYQIQQQELDMIINNQKEYYPWLGEVNPVVDRRSAHPYKLDELVAFRVPYYVGPLITEEEQAQSAPENHHFAWMVRREEGEITPWNFYEKVNREETAQKFIKRMTATDSYLIGEEVLPKQSLNYQKFMVLNELSNIRVDDMPLSPYQKQRVYKDLFMTRKSVTIKDFKDNLQCAGEIADDAKISGMADPSKFASSLSTFQDYREIIPDAINDESLRDDIEQIINWSTIFEDTAMFREQLDRIKWLSSVQKDRLSSKRYRGWGNLSKKLLTTIVDNQGSSIMDRLWDSSNNFIQIVNEPAFAKKIEDHNSEQLKTHDTSEIIDNLYTSPQNKKAIRQTLKVIEDIQKAMGGVAPSWIFIEAARDAEKNPKRTQQRKLQLKNLYGGKAKNIVSEDVKSELTSLVDDDSRDVDDKMLLYFLQDGKDLYTGKPINDLKNYQIDHIIPQAIVKDDSLDNKVLVLNRINGEKNTTFISSTQLAKNMAVRWGQWHHAGLISDRKYKNLWMKPSDIDRYAPGFINRQLVETRQVIKLVTEIISGQFDSQETKIVSIRASLSSQLRHRLNLPKIRDVNDYHHAIDAYLAARLGGYLLKRFPKLESYFVYGKYKVSRTDMRRFNFIGELVNDDKKVIADKDGNILWDPQEEYSYIHKILSWKYMLVTHKVEENNGAFFDQTIFKAKFDEENSGKSKKLVAIKKNMPTKLYGGYSKRQNAYMAIVRVNKKKPYFQLLPVPRLEVSNLKLARKQGAKKEKEFLKELFIPLFTKVNKRSGKKTEIPFEVIVPKVFMKQTFQDVLADGKKYRFGVGSSEYYQNYRQLYLSVADQRLLINRGEKPTTDEDLVNVYGHICTQVNNYFGLFEFNNFRESLVSGKAKFARLPMDDIKDGKGKITCIGKWTAMERILQGLHANAAHRDLKDIGINMPFGVFQTKNGIRLTMEAEMIFESPTGLFQRVVKLRDL